MKLGWLALILGTALRVSAAEPSFDVRLLEPAVGTRVVAGSTAFIDWDAAATPANVDEWEAFISIDGGRTVLSRVTPHLDATIHRFRLTVPDLPGADVTLLLRFGDERDERRFVFPSRMRISGVEDRRLACLDRRGRLSSTTLAHPFDVDEEGATSWIEGSRDGSSLHFFVLGGNAMSSGRAEVETPIRDGSATALTTGGSRHDSVGSAVVSEIAFVDGSRCQRAEKCALRLVSDILLMSRRRNI
ncbi:MAG TPA: hypothetical protein VF505_04420 [Thermoanaerobaculia bacterium]